MKNQTSGEGNWMLLTGLRGLGSFLYNAYQERPFPPIKHLI